MSPPPALASGPLAATVRGVARLDDRLVLLLDLARVLADEGARPAPALREATA